MNFQLKPWPPGCGLARFAPGRDTREQLAGSLPSAHATGCHGLGKGLSERGAVLEIYDIEEIREMTT